MPPEKQLGSSQTPSWASFRFLNITQFIGAMNDNIFKLLLAFCFISLEGAQSGNRILSIAGAIYVLPFIFLSSTAGILADRYSKRSIIVATRIAEILVILFGMIALHLSSKFLGFSALFLLACHSAIFGPCKYGIVPEIIPKESISKANGLLTSFSYIAIIAGTFLAAFLADITDRNYVIALSFSLVCSCIALYAAFHIQWTPPAGSKKKVTPWLHREVLTNLRIIRRSPSLLPAVIGSSFFLFAGSYVQLNMIPFAMKILHMTDVQGGYMFLLTAFGIGVGSFTSGKLSGRAVEFGLVPLGGIGMALSCIFLDVWSDSIGTVLLLVFLIGMFGGMYLVPLDSYIQVTSPKTHRGQIVATCNILGFLGVLLSAFSMYILSEVVGMEPDTGFAIIGCITLVMATAISVSISGYVIRFASLIASYFFSKTQLNGKEQIPLDTPSMFFVPHSFWPWAIMLLASQRRRMRFLTLSPQTKPPLWAALARRCIPIIEIQDINEVLPEGDAQDIVRHPIERGISVALFCSKKTLAEQITPFVKAWSQEPGMHKVSFFGVTVPETVTALRTSSLTAQIEPLNTLY